MKQKIFKYLAKLNKVIVPSFARRDLTKLSKFEKAIIGYRYYVTKNALGNG
jgi:hypothetical protein